MNNFFKNCKQYFPFSFYYMKCELRMEVARMYLGWMWWFLEPLLFMMVYVFIYSFVFQRNMEYPLPYISLGLMMWNFFQKTCMQSVSAITRYRGLLSRVDIPKYVLIINIMLVNGFKMFVNFLIAILLMIWNRVPITPFTPLFFPILLIFIAETFGVSLLLLHIGVYVADMKNIVPIALRILFYFNGVFYSLEHRLNEVATRFILRYNPIGCIMFEARNVLLYHRIVSPQFVCIWMIASIILIITGIMLINQYEKDYIKII